MGTAPSRRDSARRAPPSGERSVPLRSAPRCGARELPLPWSGHRRARRGSVRGSAVPVRGRGRWVQPRGVRAAPRVTRRSPSTGHPFPTPPPPPSPRRVSKEPCKFSSLAPSAQSPVANKLRLLSPPLSRCPLRGGGRGAGGGGGGRPCGRRAAALGRRRSGSVRTPTAPSLVRSAAPSGAAPLSAGPGRRGGGEGGRGVLSCGGPGAPAVPLPSCQAGFYGNIDRIKVPCNSVINGVSLVSKMKCGAVKLFIWKVILRILTSDTWSYIKPAS